MNALRARTLLDNRYLLAALSGLLLACAFPKLSLAGLAWLAPGLMLVSAVGKPRWERLRIGYVAGLTTYLTLLSWLLLIPYRWYGIPLGPAVGWLAASGILAFFPAVWVCIQSSKFYVQSSKLDGQSSTPIDREQESKVQNPNTAGSNVMPGSGVRGSLIALLQQRLASAAGSKPASTWLQRTGWALGGAALWVALEMVQARVLGGFPWNLLGDSQYQLLPLIQIASVTGVYGISFLLAWFSLSLVSAGQMILRYPLQRSVWVSEVFLPLVVCIIVGLLGFRHVQISPAEGQKLRVTLVQPSIPQTVIWDPAKADERFLDLLHLTEDALTNQTDLLIWPESALPHPLRNTNTLFAVTRLARRYHVWMIIGADDYELRASNLDPDDPASYNYFNCGFLINPDGRVLPPYRKRSLVMFGEYIPFQRWLPFLKWFTPIQGGFTSGDQAAHFHLAESHRWEAKASVLICFEDTFPQLGRSEPDANLLVNVTNDGWFDEGAAQWQHAASAMFRAVENGVPLVRCANNGVSCWIDPQGRIRQVLHDRQHTIYGPGFMTAEIALPASEEHGRTFYSRHGDWFGWACVGIAALIVTSKLLRFRRKG